MHASVIRHYLDGASYPIGGAQVIADAMADTVRAAGGMALAAADVAGIVEQAGQARGVRMADGEIVEAPLVISGAGIRPTLRMLPDQDVEAQELRQVAEAMPLTLPAVVLNIGLDASNADLEVDPANIWIHQSARQMAEWQYYIADSAHRPMPLHFISQPSAKDPSWNTRYPGRDSQRWTRVHSPVKGLLFTGQDVAMGGVSGAMVSGLLAASTALGRDLFRELRSSVK